MGKHRGGIGVYPAIFLVLLVIIVGSALYVAVTPPPGQVAVNQPSKQMITHEKKVLDPTRFKGEVRDGYQAAKDIPGVLSQLRCHCGCDDPRHAPYHRNLYECFTDEHGAQCGVCVQEALMASRMNANGASIGEIRNAIESKFG